MKNSEIKIKMPINVKKILSILYFEGCAGYIVGGCVRDSILGLIPKDWDICTNCIPEEMLHIFSSFKVILTGFKHGTVTVVIGGENYEITTYRIDGDYIDGRHPEEGNHKNGYISVFKFSEFAYYVPDGFQYIGNNETYNKRHEPEQQVFKNEI